MNPTETPLAAACRLSWTGWANCCTCPPSSWPGLLLGPRQQSGATGPCRGVASSRARPLRAPWSRCWLPGSELRRGGPPTTPGWWPTPLTR